MKRRRRLDNVNQDGDECLGCDFASICLEAFAVVCGLDVQFLEMNAASLTGYRRETFASWDL